jgi:DNA modification methylase
MRNSILTGDARELAKQIPDNSIDLIFTDPPYPREFLPLYGWLAEEAARVLRPGGFVLAMCGGLYLNHIMRFMDAHLTYYWKYELELAGKGLTWQATGHQRIPIVVGCKPLLAYSKGISDPRTPTLGLFKGTGSDKQYHAWGQDVASTRYYVDCFSKPGDVVLDPFCGGGTTPYACTQLGREWIAFEDNPATADTARERLQTVQMPILAPNATQSALWEQVA